ncbi:MAG: hypothetical protein RL757_542 [Bacteroidota bacterium]|jgi:hypothetical protein
MRKTGFLMQHKFLMLGTIGLAITFTACDLFRPAQSTPIVKKPEPTDVTVGGKPTDPNAPTQKLDTIKWKEDPRAKPPITNNTPKPTTPTNNGNNGGSSGNNGGNTSNNGNNNGTNGGVVVKPVDPTPTNNGGNSLRPAPNPKNSYKMAIVLPFYSGDYYGDTSKIPTKASFGVEFYAGVRMALDSLSQTATNLEVQVFDTRNADFSATLNRYEVRNADLILGPTEKDFIPSAIQFSNEKGLPVISPYFPSADLEGNNPNFVQVKPSLKVHCGALLKHVKDKYPTANVVLAANGDNEVARFRFFKEANGGKVLKEWNVADAAAANPDTYAKANQTTVFIVPSWNESFVTEFLKKLDASPNKKNFVVYGMPQWIDFPRSLHELYTRLQVRVSSSVFVNVDAPQVKDFRQNFAARYGKFPTSDAFLGFDATLFFVDMMKKYGSNFAYYLPDEGERDLMHTKFKFERQVSTNAGDNFADYRNTMKIENRFVNILKFTGYGFKPDW